MRVWVRIFSFCMAMALLLGGCAVSNPPPVVDLYGKSSRSQPVTSGSHKVARGETLYSIAWRYCLDYKSLARANGIKAPYTIYPGQVIRFSSRAAPAPKTRPRSTASSSKPAAKPVVKPVAKPAPPAAPKVVSNVRWRWPADGELVQRFSSAGSGPRGIAIAGRRGASVVAAADGTVVYKGVGLTGYGKLLIIKHNDRWLSAYAHNDNLLVKEGEQVKSGQKIATMGSSGTFRTQLHFEIRRDGQPVDPLPLLPKKP